MVEWATTRVEYSVDANFLWFGKCLAGLIRDFSHGWFDLSLNPKGPCEDSLCSISIFSLADLCYLLDGGCVSTELKISRGGDVRSLLFVLMYLGTKDRVANLIRKLPGLLFCYVYVNGL